MVEQYESQDKPMQMQPVNLTEHAQKAIQDILSEEQDAPDYLRVFVTGGGCSGFQYGFAFEYDTEEDDAVFNYDGISVVVDSMSYQYLVGATIDFVTDQFQESFVIENPLAKTSCGCGQSFSV
jgi:iron-sulfur cluster insertion protein